MSNADFQQFIEILERFEHAMLVTLRDGRLRSRPMAIGDVRPDGRIRFITRDDSAKLAELTDDPRVNVAAQAGERFLSVSGNARLSKDRRLIDQAWQRHQAPWFSEGRDDPHIIVVEVIPVYAEFWDRSGGDLVTQVLDSARAALGDGERSSVDDVGAHGEVDFRGKPL